MQYPDSYKEANPSKLCVSLENSVPFWVTESQMPSWKLVRGNISLLLPTVCFWTYLMLSPRSTGLLCVLPQSFYSSTKLAQQTQYGWFCIALGYHAFCGRIWQSSGLADKRKAEEGLESRKGNDEVSTHGWHRMIANLKLALPLIYQLALVIPLNHGLFIHLKNVKHSLYIPHKDMVRAEVWNCH